MKQLVVFLFSIAMLASCSGPQSKIVVMSSGKVTVAGNVITHEPGTTHNEVVVNTAEKNLVINSGGSEQQVNIPSEGLYIFNLKQDTLIGSYQRTGTEVKQEVITQESLGYRIDSLHMLLQGKNVSEANRNYNIPPNQLVKITNNLNADIIGPFLRVPGSFEAGKDYEIYKFYTAKEIREIIQKLEGMQSVPADDE